MNPFKLALAFTLRWEGGYSDNPADPGGATNMGVTQGTYDNWRRKQGLKIQSVKLLTQNEMEQIYYEDYWLKAACDQTEPLALAISVFDFAVNSGVGTALKTKGDISDWATYNARRLTYLTELRSLWPTFGRGWAARVAALNEYVASAADEVTPPGLLYQALGEHSVWVDNSPTFGKGMTMLSAALSRKPAVFNEKVLATRTKRVDGTFKIDLRAVD